MMVETVKRDKQEIMLGMGSVIAAHALKLRPTIYHLNEGHASFMVPNELRNWSLTRNYHLLK